MLLQSILVCKILLLCHKALLVDFLFTKLRLSQLQLLLFRLASNSAFSLKWATISVPVERLDFFLLVHPSSFRSGKSLHWRFTHFYCLCSLFTSFSPLFCISCCWSSASFSLKRSILSAMESSNDVDTGAIPLAFSSSLIFLFCSFFRVCSDHVPTSGLL